MFSKLPTASHFQYNQNASVASVSSGANIHIRSILCSPCGVITGKNERSVDDAWPLWIIEESTSSYPHVKCEAAAASTFFSLYTDNVCISCVMITECRADCLPVIMTFSFFWTYRWIFVIVNILFSMLMSFFRVLFFLKKTRFAVIDQKDGGLQSEHSKHLRQQLCWKSLFFSHENIRFEKNMCPQQMFHGWLTWLKV